MSNAPPRAFFVADRLIDVWSGWDSIGEQWFVEIFASDEDPKFFKYTINNADCDYTEHFHTVDENRDRLQPDQLYDTIWSALGARGYQPIHFEPYWFQVPLSIYLGLKTGEIPYNTTIVTTDGAVIVFDVVDPEGPDPRDTFST